MLSAVGSVAAERTATFNTDLSVRRPGRCLKASFGRASTSPTRRPGRRGCAAPSTRATTSRSWWTEASWTSQTPTKFTASSRKVPRKVSARIFAALVTEVLWFLDVVLDIFLNVNLAFIKGQRTLKKEAGVKMCTCPPSAAVLSFSVCRIPTGGQSPESSQLSDAPVLSFPATPGDFQVREKIHSFQKRSFI